MKIKNVKFLKSETSAYNGYYMPEICFVGRSNVGKSSLINYLTNSKIARTSSTPGRTQLINYFEINNGEFLLVDLPGYGFTKTERATREKWGAMIEPYLRNNQNLKNILVLLDCRHSPSQEDRDLINYLLYYHLPFTIVATKIDKLSRAELQRAISMLATELKVGVGNIYPVSSQKRVGAEELLERISQFLGEN